MLRFRAKIGVSPVKSGNFQKNPNFSVIILDKPDWGDRLHKTGFLSFIASKPKIKGSPQ